MTRARRVHQGERTHSERRIDPDRPVEVIEEGELGPGATAKLGDRVDYPREGLELPAGRVGELTVHPDGTSETRLLPEGTELSNAPAVLETHRAPERMCKTCQKHEFDGPLTVAPTGTTHVVSDDPHLTVCGREIGDDWS